MINKQNFLDSIDIEKWFGNIGDSSSHCFDCINISSLDEALSVWNDFFENRCDIWEDLRVHLTENEEWNECFFDIRESAKKMILENRGFKKLSNKISEKFSLSEDHFFSQLPIMGFLGEIILKKDGYYRKEIEIFKKGFFVCGFKNNQFIVY